MTDLTDQRISTLFTVSRHWTLADGHVLASPWWVYVLTSSEDDFGWFFEPEYVGKAFDVRRRLSEHQRFWPWENGRAHLFVETNERGVSVLENLLINTLRPRRNRAVPRLSWIEQRWYADLNKRWLEDEINLCCVGCPSFAHRETRVHRTEPSPICPRRELVW